MEGFYKDNEQIDIMAYIQYLKTKVVTIVLCGFILGAAAFCYYSYKVTPMFQASLNMIVNAKDDSYTTINLQDVTDGQKLIDTYAIVIKGNRVMNKVIETMGLNMSWVELSSKVSVNAVNETSVMNITVTDADAKVARDIVVTISEVAPDIIIDSVEAGSCKIISDPYCSGVPISPNVRSQTIKGIALGMALCSAVYIFLYLLDNTVHSEDDLTKVIEVPVLSVIPTLESNKKMKGRKS